MLAITLISEVVNDRSFVAMGEDIWALPFLVAIYCLPDKPNQWIYFVRFLSPLPHCFLMHCVSRVLRLDCFHTRTLIRSK